MATEDDLKEVIKGFGELTGKMDFIHSSITENFRTMREDMRRMEDANKANMQHLEDRLNTKVDSLGKRVASLESAEKDNIKLTAKHSVGLAAVGSAITYGFVELLKRLH